MASYCQWYIQVNKSSRIKAWWQCPNNKEYIWQTFVQNRTRGNRCHFCTSKIIHNSNCLATTNPEIAKEVDYA